MRSRTLRKDVSRVKAQRDKELKKGGKAQALEEEVKKHSNELVRLATVVDLKKSSMAEDKDRPKRLSIRLWLS